MANVIPQTLYNAKKTRDAVAPVFGPDEQALREARIVKNKLNSDRESKTKEDIADAESLAKALQEKLKSDSEQTLIALRSNLFSANLNLKAVQEKFKIEQELKKAKVRGDLLATQIVLSKHYPNGIPQSIIDELAVLYSDVIKDPDESPLWLTFVKNNNESIAHFTKVEALSLKKSIDAAYNSVANIESHIKAINTDMKAQVAIGYDPKTPLNLHGEPQDPKVVEQARKTYDSLGEKIRTGIKAASLLIKEFSAKIKPPISIGSAALLNPFNELSKVVDGLEWKDGNTPSGDFYKDAKSIVTGMDGVFKKMNEDVNSSKIRGVDNPIFGANSWYEIKDEENPKKKIYFNEKTGDSLWNSPNVISLNPNGSIPTISIDSNNFDSLLFRFPPFLSSEGVPPMIYTGDREILSKQSFIDTILNKPSTISRTPLNPRIDEKKKYNEKIDELEFRVRDFESQVNREEERLKRNPPATSISALGSREFLAAIQSLQTQDNNGLVPPPNAKLLKEIVTTLMGDPYGKELQMHLDGLNDAINDFNKFKIEHKDEPKEIAAQAHETNLSIVRITQYIEGLYSKLPENVVKNLKEKFQQIKPSAYIGELEHSRLRVNSIVAAWKKYKSETNDSPETIAKKAIDTNNTILGITNEIKSLYQGLPENVVKDLKEKISKLPPVSQVAPQSGTSTTATIASNDTPTSISTDTDATSTASKVAMPSVSASTSSSATPTSVSTESAPMQGASEGRGETNHSIDEKTGEKIQHPSWENIFKINDASKSVASSASNNVANTASVDSAPVPLEADAAIAEANASTEVPTPLKSIPAPNPASAIKIQEDMDNEAETTDNSTTDGSKKSKIVAPTTSNSIRK